MKQMTLAASGDEQSAFERYRRPTKRDEFLATMNGIVPWVDLCGVIEPHYPKAGNGRPPIGLVAADNYLERSATTILSG